MGGLFAIFTCFQSLEEVSQFRKRVCSAVEAIGLLYTFQMRKGLKVVLKD